MALNEDIKLRNFATGKEMIKSMMRMRDGLSYADLPKKRNVVFNMEELIREFVKLCPDFLEDPTDANASQISKKLTLDILYNLSPKSRKGVDTRERLRFRLESNGRIVKNSIFVYMGKGNDPRTNTRPRARDGLLHLTIDQACLLALKKFEKLIELSAAKGEYLLTPLAANVFSGSVVDLYEELKGLGVSYDIAHLVKTINQSMYRGGEHLEYSDLNAAAALHLSSTSHLRNRDLAKDIIKSRLNTYLRAGKKFDIDVFELFAKYTTIGQLALREGNATVDRPAFDLEYEGAVGGDVEAADEIEEPVESEDEELLVESTQLEYICAVDEDAEAADEIDQEQPVESTQQDSKAAMQCYICNLVFSSENKSQDVVLEV
ncbi:uncharacterized protein LOC129787212 [Lutzomyia longipalpis]|uniref:uncharacterized protein LOC129787212 n=1 Tax=Lutzomyia longipalpis TaxID=7200 RepID=UPI0024841224|nr:uncharacterized protein LOC129787212 [Lutzomyia longipalpis]